MNSSSSKRYIGGNGEQNVKGDWHVFDISNATFIFTCDEQRAAIIAVAYNHHYCLPSKQLKYFVMNFGLIFDSIINSNGASYNLHTRELNPSTGFMVAIPGFEKEYDIPTDLNKFQDIVTSYTINRDMWDKILSNPEGIYLGFWLNEGKLVIDLAENIRDMGTAYHEGFERNQIAIYDCANKHDIKIVLHYDMPSEFALFADDIERATARKAI
jgi:hypothetical protein